MYRVATLNRHYTKEATLGSLTLPSGIVLKTLERAWLNNASNISCIPEGVYRVKWLLRSASGKYKRVWHIQRVPNRLGILIHSGNLVKHTLGCPLVGVRHGRLNGKIAVLGSRMGLNKMRKELGGKDFTLHIESATGKIP